MKRYKRRSALGLPKDTEKMTYWPAEWSATALDAPWYHTRNSRTHVTKGRFKRDPRTGDYTWNSYTTEDSKVFKPEGYWSSHGDRYRYAHYIWQKQHAEMRNGDAYIYVRDLAFKKLNLQANSFGMNAAQGYKTAQSTFRLIELLTALIRAALRKDLKKFMEVYRQTYHLIGNLDSRYYNVKNERLRKRYLAATKVERSSMDSATSEWLNFSFGIMPVIIDIQLVLEKLYNTERGTPKSVASAVFEQPFVENYGRIQFSGWAKIRLKQELIVKNELYRFLRSLGITNPALVIDDAIPFSFVVDYFTNHTKWLYELDENLGVEYTRYSISTEVLGYGHGNADIRRSTQERHRAAPDPNVAVHIHKYVRSVHSGKAPAPDLTSRFESPFGKIMRTLNQIGVGYQALLAGKSRTARRQIAIARRQNEVQKQKTLQRFDLERKRQSREETRNFERFKRDQKKKEREIEKAWRRHARGQ